MASLFIHSFTMTSLAKNQTRIRKQANFLDLLLSQNYPNLGLI